jgi:hypothetical protein|tara:strand:- start:9 stop:356 length:348 start_codon:yes stop_codon:yes gene_type:complete
MPTYTFYDEKSGIEWDDFLSMADREKFLKENQHITQVIVPVAIVGDHLMGVGPKTDEGFKENMQRISAAHPGSPLADKFGGSTQSHQEIKTRNAIDKHRKVVERSGFSASRKKTL